MASSKLPAVMVGQTDLKLKLQQACQFPGGFSGPFLLILPDRHVYTTGCAAALFVLGDVANTWGCFHVGILCIDPKPLQTSSDLVKHPSGVHWGADLFGTRLLSFQ